ncbi:hypothetical protein L484_024902 [Morus notabilis]|uniref:Uncharacterized protein n=1 Tax=Morus notabilis TaxID=981085 RepID=W9R381_9ROSA|nr:hypothetical protein L484_024902 [Morus notabilis]
MTGAEGKMTVGVERITSAQKTENPSASYGLRRLKEVSEGLRPRGQGVYQERLWSVSAAKTPRYSHTDVAFNEDDASGVHFPHNDALVVEAMIGNHTVCKILVDNGSSVDLLYSDCLEKMGIQKEQLEKTSRLLYGFTGDSVIPQGTIWLPITAREKPR